MDVTETRKETGTYQGNRLAFRVNKRIVEIEEIDRRIGELNDRRVFLFDEVESLSKAYKDIQWMETLRI